MYLIRLRIHNEGIKHKSPTPLLELHLNAIQCIEFTKISNYKEKIY